MPPRLNYPKLAPDAFRALQALGHYLHTQTALDHVLLGLVVLRASHLNRCSFCIAMHTAELQHLHEPQTRIDTVANWNAPENRDVFTPRERAALAWADAITNIQQSHASDADYAAVTEYFRDKDLVDLTFAITQINAWNRLSVAFRSEWNPPTQSVAAPTHPASANA